MFDLFQVVGVEQYVIRPPEGDVDGGGGNVTGDGVSTGLLSAEVVQASALTDDLVRRAGQPLPAVIAQFDRYVRSLHIDPDSSNFKILTDGQLPFRY